MSRKLLKVWIAVLSTAMALLSTAWARSGLTIKKEVILSPGHPVMPYLITRTSNGDYVVAGSSNFDDSHAWAVRLDASGKVVWEYLDGPPNAWNDYSVKSQRMFGTIELPEQGILLCGVKRIDNHQTAFLVRLRSDGTLIDERPLRPANNAGHPSALRCIRWGDGIAVIGGLSGEPKGTGWLTKLDANGDFVWESFADYIGYSDAMEATGGGLFLIGSPQRVTSIVKLDATGQLVALHALEGEEWLLAHPRVPQSNARVAIMLPTSETAIVAFDEGLRHSTRIGQLRDAGIKKVLELPDGSVVIFGSQSHGGATASIAVWHRDGGAESFLVEPAHRSAWFYDAVPADGKNEFATVRVVGKAATLAWISVE
jgi:hypothetical protein